jgi:hypothetical protein
MMSKMCLTVAGAGLDIFGEDKQKRGGGTNFRIRLTAGVLSIKASSRTNCCDGEMFGALNNDSSFFDAFQETPAGFYTLTKAARGWHTLTACDNPDNATVNLEHMIADIAVTPIPKTKKQDAAPTTTEQTVDAAIDAAIDAAVEAVFDGGELVQEDIQTGPEALSGEDACERLGITPMELRAKILAGELQTVPGNKVIIPETVTE